MRLLPVSSFIVADPALTPAAALSVQTGGRPLGYIRVDVAEAAVDARTSLVGSATLISSACRLTTRSLRGSDVRAIDSTLQSRNSLHTCEVLESGSETAVCMPV